MASCIALGGCDPGVHFGYETDIRGKLDYDCIETALRTVAPDVTRTTWTDEGHDTNEFPTGTVVTEFNYSDPIFHEAYTLNVALLQNGMTHYEHKWSKLGTEISADEQRQILPLLNRANDAIAQRCHLSFAGLQPKQGPG